MSNVRNSEGQFLRALPTRRVPTTLPTVEQEQAVGRFFFGAFPSLLVHLKRAEARAAQQQDGAASK